MSGFEFTRPFREQSQVERGSFCSCRLHAYNPFHRGDVPFRRELINEMINDVGRQRNLTVFRFSLLMAAQRS